MIVAFDLDDTLYPEATYVESGFRAVARELDKRWGVGERETLALLERSLERDGRGHQFDTVVEELGLTGRQSVGQLVGVYRHHEPAIALPAASRKVLERLRPRHLYVVTDGHKVVQHKKLEALGVLPYLQHAYITHRYAVRHRKPSTHVFELLLRREGAEPGELAYIGDDPSKDFRGLRPLGVHTIRVRTGRHAGVTVKPSEDAERSLASLAEVPAAVAELEAA